MAKKTSSTGGAARKSMGKKVSRKKESPPALDLKHQVKIQKALYEIADAASAVSDMQSFYRKMHTIVGKLIYAKSFYITLYDPVTGMLSSPYFADEAGDEPPPPTNINEVNKSLRAYVLLKGKTLHLSAEEIEEGRRSGRFKPMGTPSEDWISVPLRMGGQVIGSVTVQSYKKGIRYTGQDVELLEFVAHHIAIALTRARAIEETRQRNREIAEGLEQQTATSEILSVIASSPTDVQPVFDAIVERAVKLCGGIYGFAYRVVGEQIYLAAQNSATKDFPADVQELAAYFPMPLDTPETESNVAPVIRNCAMLHVADMKSDPRITACNREKSRKGGSGAAIYIPLVKDNKGIGAIYIEKTEPKPFTEKQIALVKTFADQAVIAIENVRLFTETQRLLKETEDRAAELAVINSVQEGLASRLDMQAIYDLVGDKIREIFDAQAIQLVSFDHEKNLMHRNYLIEKGQRLYVDPLPISKVWAHFISSRRTFLINNVEDFIAQIDPGFTPPVGHAPKSVIAVPLMVKDEIRGAIDLENLDQENAFNDSDVRLLQTLANAMSIALENARLFDETQRLFQAEQRAREQAETLRSVAQALNSSLSLTEVFDLVLAEIQKVIPYDSAGIYQVHDNRRVFVAGHGFANLDDLIGVGFEFNQQDDEIGYLISRSLQPLVLEDAPQAYPQYFSAGSHAATKIRSYMAVPIVLNQKLIGMITLDREEPGFYTDEHARLAMAFAAQAATAINNARLFGETQQRAAELATVNTVTSALVSELDLGALIKLVGTQIHSVFKADIVYVALLDRETNIINFPYQYGQRLDPIQLGQGLTSRIIESGQPLLINQELARQRQQLGVPLLGTQAQSYLGVPILVSGEAIGVVSVQSVTQEGRFTESDQRLLSTIAASIGIALQNARLWEQEKLYRKALERELEIGREIQAGFLPETLPITEGWEVAASLMSAREVAGDFYDAFELPDGGIGIVIADVCDKGVGAALFMTLFRSLIRAAANLEYFEQTGQASAPHSTAERIQRAISLTNNYIAETHGESGMFATLFFGILDPRSGKLTYVNGGHEPPLIVHSGSVREILKKTGSAVGAILNCGFRILETQLHEGDLLVAFTDGALEAKDTRGEFFGHERLLGVLQKESGSSHEVVKAIETELQRYIAGATQFDDITLLAVKRV